MGEALKGQRAMPPSLKEGSPCPRCGGLTRAYPREKTCVDEKCRHASWIEAIKAYPFSRNSAVPRRYIRARLSDFKAGDVPEMNTEGLYLSGGAGRGKTHLATAVLAAELVKLCAAIKPADFESHQFARGYIGKAYQWVSTPELMLELRGTMDRGGSDTEQEVIKRYADPELLVLDDLYAEKVTEWTSQGVYTLISRRLNNLKPTVVTSNKRLTEIHDVDPRLASRLGGMTYHVVTGGDRRLK